MGITPETIRSVGKEIKRSITKPSPSAIGLAIVGDIAGVNFGGAAGGIIGIAVGGAAGTIIDRALPQRT